MSGKDTINHLSEAGQRKRVSLSGTVKAVTLPPEDGRGAFRALLDDGSGQIDLVWLGRKNVPGIVPGITLHVAGLVSVYDEVNALLNPEYDIVATPRE